jgi:hypothetical protein
MATTSYSPAWLICDQGICLYRETARVDRCIKHGAILTYVPEYFGLSEREARRRHADALAVRREAVR